MKSFRYRAQLIKSISYVKNKILKLLQLNFGQAQKLKHFKSTPGAILTSITERRPRIMSGIIQMI